METRVRKQVLRKITYGLYVATAIDGDETAAATVTWLSQASFQPPLVTLGVRRDSTLHALLARGVPVAVHLLGADQKALAEAFFRPTRREGNLLNGHAFEPGVTGAPLLVDVPAVFEANVSGSFPCGDHTVFVLAVVAAHLRRDEQPLALRDTGWSYGG